MQAPVLSSTVLLTALLMVGLFFFIRASTKDRIQVTQFITEQPEETLFEKLQNYFTERAYRIDTVNAADNQVVFTGLVRPSAFLAVFLSLLAAVALLCFALVLSLLFPRWAQFFPGLMAISPLAGLFYWKKSARPEQVSLQIETIEPENKEQEGEPGRRLLTVTGHRDELAELQRTLQLKAVSTD